MAGYVAFWQKTDVPVALRKKHSLEALLPLETRRQRRIREKFLQRGFARTCDNIELSAGKTYETRETLSG